MKKLIIISLLTVYVALSAGVNIFVHTCGGESTALLATSKVEDPCGCDDDAEAEKCCTSELTTVQLDAAQKVSSGMVCQPLTVTGSIPNNAWIILTSDEQTLFNRQFTSFSPPPKDDLCVVHSVFRI